MQRREFITLLGGAAAAWPMMARAQQPAMPVIGMLNGQSSGSYSHLAAAFRLGLREMGFVEGQSVAIEYRWAEGHDERLPAMAVELVNRPVAVLIAGGSLWSTISAKAATSTIPIVFTTGGDPVKLGFVPSLNRPGANVTGISFLTSQLLGKRLELAAQLVPKRSVIGFLGRPREPRYAVDKKEIETAAAALGQEMRFFEITDERDLDASFAAAAQQNIRAIVVDADAFFNSNRDALIPLAARHSLPVIYEAREFVTTGGLMSYGASIVEAYHQAGRYVGRILQGEKPGDLPILQSARFEMLINLKTAKALGLVIPPTILAQADEVIE